MKTTTATTFHASNFGRFASGLPTDSEGYVHLTAAGWVDAGYEPDEAEERAVYAREQTVAAEAALEKWRDRN